MPDPKNLPRPRQVTTAAVLIMFGSVAVLLTVFTQLSTLHSLDTQRSIESALSDPPASGLGISVDGARAALRVCAMVAAACATAAAILGYQVLQRSRSARVALSVLAVPLFVTGIASGGILSSVVVAAAVMLWLQPARDWFDGKAARPVPDRVVTPRAPVVPVRPVEAPPVPPAGSPRAQDQVEVPLKPMVVGPPSQQPAQQPAQQPSQQPAWPAQPPVQQPAWPAQPPVQQTSWPAQPVTHAGIDVEPRPLAVVWACTVTWAATGLASGLMAMISLALLAVPDLYEEVSRQNPDLVSQGITEHQVLVTALVSTAVIVLWSALATFFAVQTWRRRPWARLALLASASAAAVILVVGALASVVLVVPLAACVAVVVLLCRTEARRWLR
jgi:hypothetical protein